MKNKEYHRLSLYLAKENNTLFPSKKRKKNEIYEHSFVTLAVTASYCVLHLFGKLILAPAASSPGAEADL